MRAIHRCLALVVSVTIGTVFWSQPAFSTMVLFLDYTVGSAAQNAQEAAFLASITDASDEDFDSETPYTDITLFDGNGFDVTQPEGGFLQFFQTGTSTITSHSDLNSLFVTDGSERLEVTLDSPRNAVGFWLIDSEEDSFFGTLGPHDSIEFFDADDNLLISVLMPTSGNIGGQGSNENFFIGLISDISIGRVMFNEYPGELNGPEGIGIDNVILGTPEPGTALLLGLGLVGLGVRRRLR